MGTRTSRDRENEIIRAYEAWDPSTCSVTELAAEHGISRQALYQILARKGVVVKSARTTGAVPARLMTDDLLDRMAQQALRALLDELEEARAENRRLRDLLERSGVAVV